MTSIVCSPSSSFTYTSAYMDCSFSRDSNSAGAPLPRIPRRSPPLRSQTQPAATAASSLHGLFATPSAKLVIHPPTPPSKSPSPLGRSSSFPSSSTSSASSTRQEVTEKDEGGASSSSSGSESYVEILGARQRRVRKQRSEVRPPELSTPTPAVLEAKLQLQQAQQ